jgi:site-specific DNA-adenine methylase
LFYFYGRKKQIAKHYSKPSFDTIIEPFAGSAAYSLYDDNWKKNIILIEKDERVGGIWKWLIEEATEKEIQKMPNLEVGEKTSDFFHIVHAVTKQAFCYKTIKVTPVLARNWEISKRYISENLYKIKHWKIITGDYTESPNIEATWFIDPPYQHRSGQGYKHGSGELDYVALSRWTKLRKGQIIFCEGGNAKYLPFKSLLTLTGVAGKRNNELVYERNSV